MMPKSGSELITAIRQGVEASGQALLEEARRTNQPLVTWEDGRVVYVDADTIAEKNKKAAQARTP